MVGVPGLRRRGALAPGLATVLTAWASTAESAGGGVPTDPGPLERRFTALGPLSDARRLGAVWGTGADPRVPGPADVRVAGFARLRAGGVASAMEATQLGSRPARPSRPPGSLRPFVPENAGVTPTVRARERRVGPERLL